MIRIKKVRRALDAIAASTDVEIEAGGVRAVATRLCSPYISHQGVRFEEVEKRPGLYARAGEWHVLIGVEDPSEEYPAHPLLGVVAEWVGGLLPAHLTRRLLALAEKLGLEVEVERPESSLVPIWTLTPQVVAFSSEAGPVWALASEVNEMLWLAEMPDTARQWYGLGEREDVHLTLVPAGDFPLLPIWAEWWPGERYSGAVRLRQEDPGLEPTAAKAAKRVLVMVGGRRYYATRADVGQDEFCRTSLEDVRLDQGPWIVLAPLGELDNLR